MAKSKRVALTLQPHIDEPLTRLSKLLNIPKTAIITDLLTETSPMIVQMLQAIDQYKEGQKQLATETLEEFMARAKLTMSQSELELVQLKRKVRNEPT